MITRPAIKALLEAGLIKVSPAPVNIGPNSIDLRLGDVLKQYDPTEGRVIVRDPLNGGVYYAIDPKNPPPLIDVPKVREATTDAGMRGDFSHYFNGVIPFGEEYNDAWLLVPGQFYLAETLEETYCRGVIPHLDGRSTCGRLSIEAHKTAGVGDNGFHGRWTLEIEATEPVLVRPGDRLFQVYFTPAWGEELAHLIKEAVRIGQPIMGPKLERRPLIEVNDLYGLAGDGNHYQDSGEVRGPSPLD